MDIDIRSLGSVKVIKLRGRLSLGETVDRLRSAIENLLDSGDIQLVMDLAELATVDSSGIGLLTRALTNAKQKGGSIKLVNPSKFVVQTLKLVGILSLFEVYQDAQAAAASYDQSSGKSA